MWDARHAAVVFFPPSSGTDSSREPLINVYNATETGVQLYQVTIFSKYATIISLWHFRVKRIFLTLNRSDFFRLVRFLKLVRVLNRSD